MPDKAKISVAVNRVREVSVNWGNADVTFYFEGSEEPFSSREFTGDTRKKMDKVEKIMFKAWLKAHEIMPLRGKPKELPSLRDKPADRKASDLGTGELEAVKRNGFGIPFRGAKPGQKVCCLEFQYEGFPDGGKCFMHGVLLKGLVIAEEEDGYVVKMAFSGMPYHHKFAFEHVLPMSDGEYDRAGSADIAK